MNLKYIKSISLLFLLFVSQIVTSQYNERNTAFRLTPIVYRSGPIPIPVIINNFKLPSKILQFSAKCIGPDCRRDGPTIDQPTFTPLFRDLIREERRAREEAKKRAKAEEAKRKNAQEKRDIKALISNDPMFRGTFENTIEVMTNRLNLSDFFSDVRKFRKKHNITGVALDRITLEAGEKLSEFRRVKLNNDLIDIRINEINSGVFDNSKFGDLKIGNITNLSTLNRLKKNQTNIRQSYENLIRESRLSNYLNNVFDVRVNNDIDEILSLGGTKYFEHLLDLPTDQLVKIAACENCHRNGGTGRSNYGKNCYRFEQDIHPSFRELRDRGTSYADRLPSWSDSRILNSVDCNGFSSPKIFDYGIVLERIKTEYENENLKTAVYIPRSSSDVVTVRRNGRIVEYEEGLLHLESQKELERISKRANFRLESGNIVGDLNYVEISTEGLEVGEAIFRLFNGDILFKSNRKFPLLPANSSFIDMSTRGNGQQFYLSPKRSNCKEWGFSGTSESLENNKYWFKDDDLDGYHTKNTLSKFQQERPGRSWVEGTSLGADCDDTDPDIPTNKSCQEKQREQDCLNAKVADHVYNTINGHQNASAGELNTPGVVLIDSSDPILDDLDIDFGSSPTSGFDSALYRVTEADGSFEYIYSFAGTDALDIFKSDGDDLNDLQQAFGEFSEQYDVAVNNARRIHQWALENNLDVTFSGHSLGGGLATAASLATGRPSVVFNPAGIHENIITRYSLNLENSNNISGFFIDGEVVSVLNSLTPSVETYGRLTRLDSPSSSSDTFIPVIDTLLGTAESVGNHFMSSILEALGC